jgi:hypothetical protein
MRARLKFLISALVASLLFFVWHFQVTKRAAKPLASTSASPDPVDEQPEFRGQADAEEAAKVLCPLLGRCFQTVVTRFLYRARCFSVVDFEKGWPRRSAQYQKAMRASLNPALASAGVQLPKSCVTVERSNAISRNHIRLH